MQRILAYISLLLLPGTLLAQEQTPLPGNDLDTVTVWSPVLLRSRTDSLLIFDTRENVNLRSAGEYLAFQTPFQARIYGAGMTAGLSVRGAPVGHLQVIWNGVPLNSPLNGQSDLNLTAAGLSERMILYRGGLSQVYGSGAMAGALVLEDPLTFKPAAGLQSHLQTGSYGLRYARIKGHWSGGQTAFRLSGDWEDNDNDFRIPSIGYVNRNAHVARRHLNFSAGRQSGHHLWQTHLMYNYADRFLPGTRTTLSQSRLITDQTAWQLRWSHNSALLGHTWVQAAVSDEHYRYYYISGKYVSGAGKAVTYFLHSGTKGRLGPLKASAGYDFSLVMAATMNFSRYTRFLHALSTALTYERSAWQWLAAIRTQWTPGIRIPLTGYMQLAWLAPDHYTTYLAYSNNFKLPNFNDLYWQPGGNPDLLPERNNEWEWTQQWSSKALYLRMSAYYRTNRNLIRWIPGQNGYWHPVNINRTRARGVEWSGRWKKNIASWNFALTGSFNFQDVIDLDTKKWLIYTPRYLWTASFRMAYSAFFIDPQAKYQGFYFTDPSNVHYSPHVMLYGIRTGWRHKNWMFNLDINNLLDTYYEWIPARPMPGRTWTLGITYDLNFNKPKNNN